MHSHWIAHDAAAVPLLVSVTCDVRLRLSLEIHNTNILTGMTAAVSAVLWFLQQGYIVVLIHTEETFSSASTSQKRYLALQANTLCPHTLLTRTGSKIHLPGVFTNSSSRPKQTLSVDTTYRFLNNLSSFDKFKYTHTNYNSTRCRCSHTTLNMALNGLWSRVGPLDNTNLGPSISENQQTLKKTIFTA